MSRGIILIASFIKDGDLELGQEGVANADQNQHIIALNAVVIGRIHELKSKPTKIGKVLPVDARE